MTINKLPSGNYRIRQTVKGKAYSLTVNHKPTLYEAEQLLSKLIEYPDKLTFEKAAENYIKSKSNKGSQAYESKNPESALPQRHDAAHPENAGRYERGPGGSGETVQG